ncbi:MAG: NUDIX domain-containing protein [Bacteroidota bacterium]
MLKKPDVFQAKKKVLAYITRQSKSSTELLIFSHRDYPEAGLQVPGGSLEAGESLEEGLIREVKEESGLSQFKAIQYLGESQYTAIEKEEIHLRHFFQLHFEGNGPDAFTHLVRAGEEDKGLVFQYYWVDLEPAPPLAADQDCLLYLL